MGDQAHWLEVSLMIDGELAEAVAEVLCRFTSNGVVIESGVIYQNAEDEGTPISPVKVYGYMVVDEHIEETRRKLEESLWYLGRIQSIPQPAFRLVVDENWMEAWKKNYHPIPIGKRLLVLPAWIPQQDHERLAVKIDPSMAFGTGTHPSTQLCLEMVEDFTVPGQPLIDVGCGSGILSIAGLKLGASHALCLDVDPASILATQENSEANGVGDRTEARLGSVEEVLSGSYSITQAPLVLANILAPVILRLFDDGLAGLVSKDGYLVLAGILAEQVPEVLDGVARHGMGLSKQKQVGDWVGLAVHHQGH